ncbi:respiratory nitrate reductase subunit gamma [Streptomyces murinus]|uniref:respiratory nitrate reductase subunit gamma n=1 Tax=Streptomyces murinus TaxID=33900 RepID=UPI002379B35B|nr:respiratory nitrate reductase subunit gamma [Streptomyces murinus]WDO10541.1 respiratory nitrate reductase subunit gamma [Streptomyces murinus]
MALWFRGRFAEDPRLVHAWSVPLWYLWRPYVLYRGRVPVHPAEPGTGGRRRRRIGVRS